MSEISRLLDLMEKLLDSARELRKAGVTGSAEFSRKADQIYNMLSDVEQSLRNVEMTERGAAVTRAVGLLQRAGAEIPAELKAEIATVQQFEKRKQK